MNIHMKKNLIALSMMATLAACGSSDDDDDDVVTPTNTAAAFAGDLSGSVTEDMTLTVTGTATVSDDDAGEATFVAETAAAGTYGTLAIDAAGAWTYTLTNDDTAVQALDANGTLTDTVSVASADGTTQDITITINGADEVVALACSSAVEIAGVGGLAFATDDNLAAEFSKGKYPKEVWNDDLDSGWTGSTSRASDGSTDKAISGEVSAVFKLTDISTVTQLNLLWDKGNTRTTEYKVQTATEYSADDSTWTEVLAQGNSTQLDAEGFETVTLTASTAEYIRITGYQNSGGSGWISLNEMEVMGCSSAETSMAANLAATFGGDLTGSLTTAQTEATGSLTIFDLDGDMITAQSDITGDTQTYGTLDIDADGAWTFELDDTSSAVMALTDGDAALTDTYTVSADDGTTTQITITIEAAAAASTANLKLASIVDTSDDDAGQLRYKVDSADAQDVGKVTVSVRNNSTDQDAFFMLYSGSTSTDDALVDLRIKKDGSFEVRGDDSDTVSFTAVTPGDWIEIEATWDASSDTEFATINLTVNGETQSFTSFTTLDEDDTPDDNATDDITPETVDAFRTLNFKFAGGDATTTGNYDVDNIKLYSDIAGTVEVFATDFEDDMYVVGEDLEADTDPTPFDGSTVQAFVADGPDAP